MDSAALRLVAVVVVVVVVEAVARRVRVERRRGRVMCMVWWGCCGRKVEDAEIRRMVGRFACGV